MVFAVCVHGEAIAEAAVPFRFQLRCGDFSIRRSCLLFSRCMSNGADIRPSLVRLGAQNGPQRRPFSAVPRRLPQQPDSLAERGGFEPPYMDPAPVASRSID